MIHLERLLKEAAQFMSQGLQEGTVTAMEWNHMLYEAAMKKPNIAVEIQAGSIAIFPNQCKEDQQAHKLFTVSQIRRDPQIPEILKDVEEMLQRLDNPTGAARTTLRQMLLPQEFTLVNESTVPQYELSTLIEYIHNRCNRGYRVSQYSFYSTVYNNAWKQAWELMLSCGPDDGMYELSNVWYNGTLPERNKIDDQRFTDHLWRTTYCSVLESMTDKIENLTVLNELKIEPLYQWLNSFYGKSFAYLHEGHQAYRRIFPDQEGRLTRLVDLSKDTVQEEELKEIAECFKTKDVNCSLYRELLDRSVKPNGWNIGEKDDREVAMRINNVVQKLLMECNLSQAELIYQEACTRLLGWIEEHSHKAQEYFPAFYNEEDRMRLLTPKAAASMQKKAKGYARLMDILGTDDPEKMEGIVRRLKQGSSEGSYYDSDTDMWLDSELMELCQEERDEVCRKIGMAGEQYVFVRVGKELEGQGYQLAEQQEGMLRLTGENEEYRVFRPDTSRYHQAGWDIKVTRSVSVPVTSITQETSWYLEVKTHTPASIRRGMLQISNKQMNLAADCGDNYILVSVTYNYHTGQVEGVTAYKNLFRQLAIGVLVNTAEGYLLRENA